MRAAEQATRAAFAAVVPLLVRGHHGARGADRARGGGTAARCRRHGLRHDHRRGRQFRGAALPAHGAADGTGDLVLIDAGAEYRGYASDITRTYPVGGRLGAEQQELHALVHAAERAAIDRCMPGTEWVDVHLTAARVIAEGLVALGLLRGEPTALVESGAVWLFFPTVSAISSASACGTPPARCASAAAPHLRSPTCASTFPLQAGFVVTVEPGIYFVPAMLRDPERRRRHRDAVNWDRADRMLDFGGIRIEDNLLITAAGHEILDRGRAAVGLPPRRRPDIRPQPDGRLRRLPRPRVDTRARDGRRGPAAVGLRPHHGVGAGALGYALQAARAGADDRGHRRRADRHPTAGGGAPGDRRAGTGGHRRHPALRAAQQRDPGGDAPPRPGPRARAGARDRPRRPRPRGAAQHPAPAAASWGC